MYSSGSAQCDPCGLTSASSLIHNTDLPTPDVEGHKGDNTSACYQQVLRVTRVCVVCTICLGDYCVKTLGC